MAEPAKPGTACLCCRRRKLKCSREPSGCSNCQKTDLPCIYPTENNVRRKRGPYKKKDQPAREAHLEHVVKYLSDPVAGEGRSESDHHTGASSSSPVTSEDLVKDALIALTRTSVSDPPHDEDVRQEPLPTRHLLQAWNLFTIRVDPVTKVVLCSEIAPRFFSYVEGHSWQLGDTICFAAISSCTAEECQTMFDASKTTLQDHFRKRIQRDLLQSHTAPDLEAMQALVLYLACVCREDVESETWALFSLVVRNAQLMGLHKDPSMTVPPPSPVQAELRRRLWWTICSLESRCTEEGVDKTDSLLSTVSVKLPINVNDYDLYSSMTELPQPRKGITSMSFALLRWHIMRYTAHLCRLVQTHETPCTLQQELDQIIKLLHEEIIQYCHESRPYDWLILSVGQIMITKCRILINFPGNRTNPASLSAAQRCELLSLSVKIIQITYNVMTDPRSANHMWFFRSYSQWHSLAILITELGNIQDPVLLQSSWAALEPFVNMWKRIYHKKQQDTTWRHVNNLIERAQQIAHDSISKPQVCCSKSGISRNCAEGILGDGTLSIGDANSWPEAPTSVQVNGSQGTSVTLLDNQAQAPQFMHNGGMTVSDNIIPATSMSGNRFQASSMPDSGPQMMPMADTPQSTAMPWMNNVTMTSSADFNTGSMVDPLLDLPEYAGTFEADLDALNTVFADPNWENALGDNSLLMSL